MYLVVSLIAPQANVYLSTGLYLRSTLSHNLFQISGAVLMKVTRNMQESGGVWVPTLHTVILQPFNFKIYHIITEYAMCTLNDPLIPSLPLPHLHACMHTRTTPCHISKSPQTSYNAMLMLLFTSSPHLLRRVRYVDPYARTIPPSHVTWPPPVGPRTAAGRAEATLHIPAGAPLANLGPYKPIAMRAVLGGAGGAPQVQRPSNGYSSRHPKPAGNAKGRVVLTFSRHPQRVRFAHALPQRSLP